jgi:hypothetical protein
MARLVWTVLCGRATIDSQTNNLSLIDVIEEFTVQVDPSVKLPFANPVLVPISLVLVSMFERSNPAQGEKILCRAIFVRPTGAQYPATNFDVDMSQHARARFLLNINGIPVVEPGMHYFEVEMEVTPSQFHKTAKLPVEIKLA